MIENEAKTNPAFRGWPSEADFDSYSEVGLTSIPSGTAVDESFPIEAELPALPDEEPAPPGFAAHWDAAAGRFAEEDAQSLLSKLCKKDKLSITETSQPESRAVVLGEERRLPWQPGVPLWALAFRESVSRARRWTDAEALRSKLAGAFYRSFLQTWFVDLPRDWPESNDVWLEHLYKSCTSHGNDRSRDLGDRRDLGLSVDWSGSAASAVLVEALRRGGYRLKLPFDWSDLVHRKDWNLDVTEYDHGAPPKTPFVNDGSEEPKARPGDLVNLALHDPHAPPEGHTAMVLAANLSAPDRGWLYVASGSTGPMRTVAVDLVRVEPRDPGYRHPYPPGMQRPRPGCAYVLELNRTSLLLPTRRLKTWSKDGLRQLKVEPIR